MSRRDEILAEECEMSSVHSLISNLPTDLDTEQMITNSYQLYNDYPVNMVAKYGRLRLNDRSELSTIIIINYFYVLYPPVI